MSVRRTQIGRDGRGKHRATRRSGLPPSAGGLASRLAFARAKAAGLALDPLLRKAGLTRRQIDDPRALIRVGDQIRFLNLVAEALDDDLLGFHLAKTQDLREIGLLYYVLASSGSLIEALQRAARYSSIANEGIALRCSDGKALRISFHYVGVSRHPDRHQIEFWMTGLVRICRQLTGLRLQPSRVRLTHRRPWDAELAEFLGDHVEFGTTSDDITFSGNAARAPVVSADLHLNGLLRSYCEEALSRKLKARGSFRAQVENAVAPPLPHGKAEASEIARQLGMSKRTLARRLADEGLSFSGLLDDLRAGLADRYLSEPGLAIAQIAWLLGYRDAAAFSHAFKRWTGKTPGRHRAGGAPGARARNAQNRKK